MPAIYRVDAGGIIRERQLERSGQVRTSTVQGPLEVEAVVTGNRRSGGPVFGLPEETETTRGIFTKYGDVAETIW